MSGIMTSSNTKSGFSFSTCSKACCPLFAVTILNFSFVKSTFNRRTFEITSSTIRILYSDGFISIFIFSFFFRLRQICLKYSIIRSSPSSNSIVGCHPSFSFANDISGCRCLGSSCGKGLKTIFEADPTN